MKNVNFEVDFKYFEFPPKIHGGTFTSSIHAGFKGIFCNLKENSPGSICLPPPRSLALSIYMSKASSFLVNLGSARNES